MSAFAIPGTNTDWSGYTLFKGPTNPYSMYNTQDRFLNSVYRAFTTGELGNLFKKWNPDAIPGTFTPISFQYEKQTNLASSQHLWATTALVGLGYSINNADLGSSDSDKAILATLNTMRSSINAALETALQIGNGVRYSAQMEAPGFAGSTQFPTFSSYEYKVKLVRGGLGVAASFGFTLNAFVAIGIAGKQLDMAIHSDPNDPRKSEKIQIAAISLASCAANASANFLKGMNGIGSLSKVTQTVTGQIAQMATDAARSAMGGMAASAVEAALRASTLKALFPDLLGKEIDGLIDNVRAAVKSAVSASPDELEGVIATAIRTTLTRELPLNVVANDLDVIERITLNSSQTAERAIAQDISSLLTDGATATYGSIATATQNEISVALRGIQGAERLTDSEIETVTSQIALSAARSVSAPKGAGVAVTQSVEESTSTAFEKIGAGIFAKSPVSTVSTFSARVNKGLGVAGSILGLANAGMSIGALAPILARTDLTEEQRGIIIGEMTVQVAGGLTQAASSLALAINLARGLSTGAAIVGPALGAAAAGVVLCLSPLQIYGLVKQSEYADKLDELGREMCSYGYAGDGMLADLYRDKTAAEGGILAATTTLAVVGSAVSIAAATSVVAAPVAVIVGIATAIVSGILQGVTQPIIEKIATDYANKIKAQGGAFEYFGKSLDANYAQFLASGKTEDYLQSVQGEYSVDSVIGVSTVTMSSSARELAAITKTSAEAQANKAYVDRFVNGQIKADKTINIDAATGVVNMGDGGGSGSRQLLTFLTPLMSPGTEKKVRTQTGKNSYATTLTIIGDAKAWTVNDGVSSSVMDISNVVTRVVDAKGKLAKEIGVVINAGGGDDTLIAGASQTEYHGGAGNNSVSYADFGKDSGIDVFVTDYGFKVIKNLKAVETYQESITSQTVSYGKRTETVQYRDFALVTKDISTEDHLYDVSNISGTGGNDTIRGNDANNVIAGGLGNDKLYGNGGDDRFMQNLSLEYDAMDGGAGNDTVDYSISTFVNGQRDFVGRTGVVADLANGKIYKYKGYRDDVYDLVSNIENVLGTSLNDTLLGDGNNNILIGGDGSDTISGGAGNDILMGGDGDDIFIQSQDWESDTLDGGAGNNTVDYGGPATLSDGPGLLMGGEGIWADLSTGKIYKYQSSGMPSNSGIYDNVTNIENVTGSSLNDTLLGDDHANVFKGGAGDDFLDGGDGNDILDGGDGNDILVAGAGNDTLIGGAGNDMYVFGRDDGQDTIKNAGNTADNTDTLMFKPGIATDQLWFSRTGSNLSISITGTTDAVLVRDWYLGAENQVQKINTADGHTLFNSDVEKLVQAMASFAAPAFGHIPLPAQYQARLTSIFAADYQAKLAPVIAANWH